MAKKQNRYQAIIERIFLSKYKGKLREVDFDRDDSGVGIACEKHYKLVPPDEVTERDLEQYRTQAGR